MKVWTSEFENNGCAFLYVVVRANNKHAAKRKARKLVKNPSKRMREDIDFCGGYVYYSTTYRANKEQKPLAV